MCWQLRVFFIAINNKSMIHRMNYSEITSITIDTAVQTEAKQIERKSTWSRWRSGM